ncbi:hypothetical protein C9154_21170, partial [Escherichia coli]
MSEKLQVVTLLGSLRKGSFNGMVARTLPKIAPASMEVNALPSIADIPLYDADVLNRPGFPGEYFICELRLPDHYFRWKH